MKRVKVEFIEQLDWQQQVEREQQAEWEQLPDWEEQADEELSNQQQPSTSVADTEDTQPSGRLIFTLLSTFS